MHTQGKPRFPRRETVAVVLVLSGGGGPGNTHEHLTLGDIWPISNLGDYKLHFARWNGDTQPLDVWVRDKNEWQGWQEYWPKRNDFNRPYIFSLMQFYH